jgi:hypothetical protein
VGESYYEGINPESPKYYAFQAENDTDVDIGLTSYVQDPKALAAYLSFKPTNQYPDENNYDIVLQGRNVTLELSKENLTGLCKSYFNSYSNKSCYIYITVKSTQSTFFTLGVREKHDEIRLLEGVA